MKPQPATLRILRALERTDRNAALVELVRDGVTADDIAHALSDAARATFTIRGRTIPDNRMRVRALTVALKILIPDESPTKP